MWGCQPELAWRKLTCSKSPLALGTARPSDTKYPALSLGTKAPAFGRSLIFHKFPPFSARTIPPVFFFLAACRGAVRSGEAGDGDRRGPGSQRLRSQPTDWPILSGHQLVPVRREAGFSITRTSRSSSPVTCLPTASTDFVTRSSCSFRSTRWVGCVEQTGPSMVGHGRTPGMEHDCELPALWREPTPPPVCD